MLGGYGGEIAVLQCAELEASTVELELSEILTRSVDVSPVYVAVIWPTLAFVSHLHVL